MPLLGYIRTFHQRQHVRPWALAGPVLVLVIALPLLRPLRAPSLYDLSGNELSRLATVEALVENGTQAIEETQCFTIMRGRQHAGRDGGGAAGAPDLAGRTGLAAPVQASQRLRGGLAPPATRGTRTIPAPLRAARKLRPSPPAPLPAVADALAVGQSYYSDKPPVMSFLLSGPYWVMRQAGLSFKENPILVSYLLTLLGVTLPVAGAAGLIYRMGRTFELPRRWRTGLGIAVTLGSGLISYAVALNSHAPAAVLVLSACACLIHVGNSRRPHRTGGWLVLGGACAALAAVIDLAAGIFLVGLVFVVLSMRWRKRLRLAGALMYALGALPPLALHAALTVPVTGNLLPGFLHQADSNGDRGAADRGPQGFGPAAEAGDDDSAPDAGYVHAAFDTLEKILAALIGSRGVFSHFPVMVLGMAGIALVLRRHWPASTKALACVTLVGGGTIILAYVFLRADWTQAMFGPRWFIVFLPLTLFWAGAWLRKSHGPAAWTLAAVLWTFSTAVSLVGLADPFVPAAPGQYTAAAAVKKLIAPAPAVLTPPALAGR